MEYFIMHQKSDLLQPLDIRITNQEFEQEKSPYIMFCIMNEDTSFPDLFYKSNIYHSFCFCSEALYELMQIYEDEISGIPVVFIDNESGIEKLYYQITLECIESISDPKVTKYSDIVLYEDKVKGKMIFEMECNRQRYIVGSLQLVENMLRKNFYGIQYIVMKMEGGRGVGDYIHD